MAQKRRRTVLYEVIKQNQSKITLGKKTTRLRSEKSVKKPFFKRKKAKKESESSEKREVIWPPKRRFGSLLDKFVSGRRISSMLYPIRIILVLTVVLIVLTSVKLGQRSSETGQSGANSSPEIADSEQILNSQAPLNQDSKIESKPPDKASEQDKTENNVLIGPLGDHIIVIMTYRKSRDLEPVKEFFAEHSIKTEIRKQGDYFFLLTKDKYQSTERKGSDGFIAKERIKKIGANYQAPAGYETFGSVPFQDVYGMKIR